VGRFYSVAISSLTTPAAPAANGNVAIIGGVSNALTFTSVTNGVFNPAALLVEFDFFSYINAAAGTDGATITIHGVSLSNISQAQKFTGRNVQVSAGMSGGLPLEDPTQKGLILSGQIRQAWANWVGTEMNLNLLVFPSGFTNDRPGNFVLNWVAGTSLQDALTVTLNTAYATATTGQTPIGLQFNLSRPYILGRNVNHQCATLTALSDQIFSTTQSPGASTDSATGVMLSSGVTISTPVNNTIIISDNVLQGAKQKPIKYTDMIGQPTWVNANSMMVTTVMRGDIQVGSLLTMPQGPGGPGQVTLSGVGNALGAVQPSNINYQTAFQGQFQANAIRHIGNSRDTGPTAWVSVFDCLPLNIGASHIPSSTAVPGAFSGG